MWLLVEWNNSSRKIFPSYGITRRKYVVDRTNLQSGNIIRVRDKYNRTKQRARVLMLSESRGPIEDYKKTLRRRDHRVRHILSTCMETFRNTEKHSLRKKRLNKLKRRLKPLPRPAPQRTPGAPVEECLPGPSNANKRRHRTTTIPDVPTSPSSSTSITSSESSSSPVTIHVHDTSGNCSSCPNSDEINRKINAKRKRKLKKPVPPVNNSGSNSSETCGKSSAAGSDTHGSQQPRPNTCSMVCSKPLLPIKKKKAPRIVYDMFTQTDPVPSKTMDKLSAEAFALFLKELYSHFLQLVSHVEDLQARLGEKEAPQGQDDPAISLNGPGHDLLNLFDPLTRRKQSLAEILKGLNINMDFSDDNSQDTESNDNLEENSQGLNGNSREQNKNIRNSCVKGQDSDETDQNSDDDTEKSDKNSQDLKNIVQDSANIGQIVDNSDEVETINHGNEDNDDDIEIISSKIIGIDDEIDIVSRQIEENNGLVENVNNPIVLDDSDPNEDFDYRIPNINFHIDVADQMAAGVADMREIQANLPHSNEGMQEIQANLHDPDEDMEVFNDVLNAFDMPIIIDHLHIDDNVQMMGEDVLGAIEPMLVLPAVPELPGPALPGPAAPQVPEMLEPAVPGPAMSEVPFIKVPAVLEAPAPAEPVVEQAVPGPSNVLRKRRMQLTPTGRAPILPEVSVVPEPAVPEVPVIQETAVPVVELAVPGPSNVGRKRRMRTMPARREPILPEVPVMPEPAMSVVEQYTSILRNRRMRLMPPGQAPILPEVPEMVEPAVPGPAVPEIPVIQEPAVPEVPAPAVPVFELAVPGPSNVGRKRRTQLTPARRALISPELPVTPEPATPEVTVMQEPTVPVVDLAVPGPSSVGRKRRMQRTSAGQAPISPEVPVTPEPSMPEVPVIQEPAVPVVDLAVPGPSNVGRKRRMQRTPAGQAPISPEVPVTPEPSMLEVPVIQEPEGPVVDLAVPGPSNVGRKRRMHRMPAGQAPISPEVPVTPEPSMPEVPVIQEPEGPVVDLAVPGPSNVGRKRRMQRTPAGQAPISPEVPVTPEPSMLEVPVIQEPEGPVVDLAVPGPSNVGRKRRMQRTPAGQAPISPEVPVMPEPPEPEAPVIQELAVPEILDDVRNAAMMLRRMQLAPERRAPILPEVPVMPEEPIIQEPTVPEVPAPAVAEVDLAEPGPSNVGRKRRMRTMPARRESTLPEVPVVIEPAVPVDEQAVPGPSNVGRKRRMCTMPARREPILPEVPVMPEPAVPEEPAPAVPVDELAVPGPSNVVRMRRMQPIPAGPAPILPEVPERPEPAVPEAPIIQEPAVPEIPAPAEPVVELAVPGPSNAVRMQRMQLIPAGLAPIIPVYPVLRQPILNARKVEVRRVSAQSTIHGEPMNPSKRRIYGIEENMIAIGHHKTLVPKRVIDDIRWRSYTTATRQLLQAVFPRKILATHSLSGKQSPAFADHPRKRALDQRVVDDIVQIVRERCGAEKSWVRTVITTKCTDEARLYRNRRSQNRNEGNQENPDPEQGPRRVMPEDDSNSNSFSSSE